MGYRIGVPTQVSGGDGTVVVSAVPCTLFGIVVGKVAAGQTLAVHDCAASGDVAAGNRKALIEWDTRESLPFGTDGASFRVGLVVVASGGAGVATVVTG